VESLDIAPIPKANQLPQASANMKPTPAIPKSSTVQQSAPLRAVDTNATKSQAPAAKTAAKPSAAHSKVVAKKPVSESSEIFSTPAKQSAEPARFQTPAEVPNRDSGVDESLPESDEDEARPSSPSSGGFFWFTTALALVAVGVAIGFAKVPAFRNTLQEMFANAKTRITSATNSISTDI